MEKFILESIVKKSGGSIENGDINGLLKKLNYLEATKRYDGLIKRILPANNRGDFLGSVFETNIAFQFESKKIPLEYGVKQNKNYGSDIDLLMKTDSGHLIYLEAKLLQQDTDTNNSIANQLKHSSSYTIFMDGDDINNSIFRLQNTIVGKVQNRDGTPIKFFSTDTQVVNIIVINVSELIIGCIDIFDCTVATHGSSYVQKNYGEGYVSGSVFGLFQFTPDKSMDNINKFQENFEHVRSILHGVLFLSKAKNSDLLSYDLEGYMCWNPNLMNLALGQKIVTEISKAIPIKGY